MYQAPDPILSMLFNNFSGRLALLKWKKSEEQSPHLTSDTFPAYN